MILRCEKCNRRIPLGDGRGSPGGGSARCPGCRDVVPSVDELVASGDPLHAVAGASARETEAPEPPREAEPEAGSGQWEFDGEAPAAPFGAADRAESAHTPASAGGIVSSPGRADAETPVEDATPPVAAEATPAGSDLDALGGPETWDLLHPSSAPSSGFGAESGPEALACELERPEALESAQLPEGSTGRGLPATRGLRLPRPHDVLGSALCVALLVWLTAGIGRRATMPPVAAPGSVVLGELVAEDLRTRHIHNALGGTVLVVSGRLRNPGSDARRLGAGLRVALLDARGAALPGASSWAGPAHPERVLREQAPASLAEVARVRARTLARTPIGPAEPLAFDAVFTSPPPEARRFRLALIEEGGG